MCRLSKCSNQVAAPSSREVQLKMQAKRRSVASERDEIIVVFLLESLTQQISGMSTTYISIA